MSNWPEKIWAIPFEGSPDTGRFFPSKLAGTTEYTRTDLVALDSDAIWNEAIEAAMQVYAVHSGPDTWDYFGAAYNAIRALKRQQGGNEA